MKPYCIIIIISAFFINSCRLNNEPDNKSALNDLVKKYPELYGNGVIEKYKLYRKVYNIHDSVEMQLLEDEHSENQIIILSNSRKQVYAVSLPSNDQRTYWMFYNEKPKQNYSERNFNAEMHSAFNRLAIKESYNKGIIFNDIMFSLLQASPIFPVDSAALKRTSKVYNDSCIAIQKNNARALMAGIGESSWMYLNTFEDYKRGRYFQFISDTPYGSPGFKITVYREPCRIELIYL